MTPTIVVIVKWLVNLMYDRQRESFSIQMVMYYIENNDHPIETPMQYGYQTIVFSERKMRVAGEEHLAQRSFPISNNKHVALRFL
jgi:hypothetical protein